MKARSPMTGRVAFVKDDNYMIRCTSSEAPYLWAVGQLYEFTEAELSFCK